MALHGDKPLSAYPLLPLSPDIPSDADALSARTQIRIAEAEIHRLDFQISIILAKRARIFARIDRCRTVIAPYKRLPAKLVKKVLVLCAPGFEDASNPPAFRAYEIHCRLIITQICATWRRIAFDESLLWNLNVDPHNSSVQLTVEWFQQCSASKLGLNLSNSFEKTKLLSVAAKTIAPYSKRLRSLALSVDKAMLNFISQQRFENLEELSLNLNPEIISCWAESDVQFGMSLPSLRSLKVALPPEIPYDQLLLRLPLSQLTNLQLRGSISGIHPTRVLSECTSSKDALSGVPIKRKASTTSQPPSLIP